VPTNPLAERMGITGASLYNAFGDKRSLFDKVLEHACQNGKALVSIRLWVEQTIQNSGED